MYYEGKYININGWLVDELRSWCCIYILICVDCQALKKYIKSEPVRKEKAESAKSLGEVIKRYRTQRKMTKNLWQSLQVFQDRLNQNGKVYIGSKYNELNGFS